MNKKVILWALIAAMQPCIFYYIYWLMWWNIGGVEEPLYFCSALSCILVMMVFFLKAHYHFKDDS